MNQNDIPTFAERMQEDKDRALARRNKGLPAGQHESWNYKRPPMLPLDKLYMITYQLEMDLAQYKEWQYMAVAAVESALFAYELEETF